MRKTDSLVLTEPKEEYAEEIESYRQAFIENGDHMDGCGPLRKYEDPNEYIKICKLRADRATADEAGGYARQFICVRGSDNHVVGMAQYRYEADPRFRIGYSVRPDERGKGYASWILSKLLEMLKREGLSEIIIACEPSNSASMRVIANNGGKYVESCEYNGIELNVFSLS